MASAAATTGWLCSSRPDRAIATRPRLSPGVEAPSRAAVDAFHTAALRLGGRDKGAPGARPDYSPTYYAAFVTDLDGYKLEAVHQ